MIMFLVSVIFSTLFVFLFVGCIYKIFWTIVDIFRMFLYHKCGMKKIFTIQEMIDYKLIEETVVVPETVVLDSANQTHDEFWDNMNTNLDIQYKQSIDNPDEILFQGRVKRRR